MSLAQTVPELAGIDLGLWLASVLPVALLLGLVLHGRWSTGANAALALVAAVVAASLVFGGGARLLGVAVGKGVWTGLWILYVIWPALLLYQVAATGGMERLGEVLKNILPRRIESILLLAWVFPGFIQGVAGFGAPIAVAAPLLMSVGVNRVWSISLPLVGYHWAVTFGSMGSSFYMGALTAGLSEAGISAYAFDAAVLLAVNVLIAGALVCLLEGGLRALRDGARMLLTIGPLMGVVLIATALVEPAIASLAAGTAGLLGVAVLRVGVGAGGNSDPGSMRAWVVALPYAYLLVLVVAVFLPAPLRRLSESVLVFGPSYPATTTAGGWTNPSVTQYTPIQFLGHPGTFIMLAVVLGLLTYRAAGIWPRNGLPMVLRQWREQALRSTFSVVALTTLAAVMLDAGMVRVLAQGIASVTGEAFRFFSPLVGAIGAFATGSTTTSNAMFAALQRDVAELLRLAPSHFVAMQTAGGNVGNIVAPVVILVGATAVGAPESVSQVLRRVVGPSLALLATVASVGVVLSVVG